MSKWDFPFPESWLEAWHAAQHKGLPTTIRECIDCGCLVSGGPTRCKRCAKEAPHTFIARTNEPEVCAGCGKQRHNHFGQDALCNAPPDVPFAQTFSKRPAQPDMVNHPPHYTFGRLEVIDVIEDWKLDFNLGNAVKYIARAAHKGHELEDLEKARWYLERRISQLKASADPR